MDIVWPKVQLMSEQLKTETCALLRRNLGLKGWTSHEIFSKCITYLSICFLIILSKGELCNCKNNWWFSTEFYNASYLLTRNSSATSSCRWLSQCCYIGLGEIVYSNKQAILFTFFREINL